LSYAPSRMKRTGRPKSENDVQVSIRVPSAALKLATKLAADRSVPGLTVTRSDALRVALDLGLRQLAAMSPKSAIGVLWGLR